MREIPKMKGEMKMNDLMFNRKVFVAFLISVFLVSSLLIAAPVGANPGILYVDDDGLCGGNTPCYLHPQDAVNNANPGDKILAYPGTYDSRYIVCDPAHPSWCSPNDNWAPALIVYKDGLTIKSVEGPANTIIQSTHNFWSNAIAVVHSTGTTTIHGSPIPSGWAPNAIVVVASNTVIDGFTLHRPRTCSNTYDCFWNTAGVMIGSKGAGYSDYLGMANGNTVKNSVFDNVWHAVYIWHSSGNKVVNNVVAALGDTGHWAAISTYDGYNDAQINLGHLSENNLIAHNTIADKGIALGAWAPPTWTSNAGSKVCCNTATQVGVTYAHGPVIIGCNTGGFWQDNTDNVLRVKGVTYTGDTGVIYAKSVTLSAQLSYDGSSDGSGVEVSFTVDGNTYSATTTAGGSASTTADLQPGIYTITTTVAICDDCQFTDTAPLTIGRIVSIDIKPGSYPNSINLKSKGVVPVAVLGTSDFDVATVDPSSVIFAGASAVKWALEDVNGDGKLDLVLHFKTEQLVGLGKTSTTATLTGSTYDGIPIQGTDTVNIVPK